MRGHIEQRAVDSYSIKIRLGKDPTTGKYQQKWFTVKGSRKDAETKLTDILRQLDTGTFIDPQRIIVLDYLDKWLDDYVKPNLSPMAYERYRDISRIYLKPVIGKLLLTKLQPQHLQNLYSNWQKQGLSPGTIRYHHAVMHKALQMALKWGLVIRNVADGVELPRKKQHEMQTWDEDEMLKFLESTKDCQYYQLFYLALFTGMRRSELLALRWQDVDLLLGQIHVTRSFHHLKDGSNIFSQPKSAHSRRTIALSPSAILVLKDFHNTQMMDAALMGKAIKDDDLIFNFLGKPLRPNTITRAWQTQARWAGVKVIRFHDARHTHASLMLKQGIHPKIVQERLGHASIQMTLDTYSHVVPGLQEAAAMRFDELVGKKDLISSQIARESK